MSRVVLAGKVFDHLHQIGRFAAVLLIAVQIAIGESDESVAFIKRSQGLDILTFELCHFAACHHLKAAHPVACQMEQLISCNETMITVGEVLAQLTNQRECNRELLQFFVIAGVSPQA